MSEQEREKSPEARKPLVSSLFETGFELVESEEDESDMLKELLDTDQDVAASVSSGQALTPKLEGELDPLLGGVFAGKYDVLSVLGKGGMSTVYKVKHQDLGVVLALKVLHKHLWTDPLSVERFRLEAKTIGRLSSPYLITFRDFGVTADGQPYLVMDYLEGVSLGRKIYDENGIALDACLDIFEKLCEGLQEAHRNGVTHRDIKPANVMFLSEGSDSTVKLVDFGIAKLAAEESDQRMTLTQTGEVFGSPLYMSPEQCLGLACDHRSDIYSLGCLFYESIVGLPPFIGSNVLETMNAHVDKEPQEIGKANEDFVSRAQELGFDLKDINYVVMKCLQKVPADRYQSVEEILRDLRRIKEKNPITGKQKLWKKADPKRKFQVVSISVCAAIVIAFGTLYFANSTFKSLVDSAGQQIQWQYESTLGFIACTLRDFEAAEAHYRNSLTLADNMTSPSERHVKRLASLEALAGALQYQAKYPDKDKVVEEHKRELRQSLGDLATVEDEEIDLNLSVDPDNEEQALANMRIFDKLGKESARIGKTDTAARYLARSYEIKRKWLKEGDESLIRTMDDLAKIYVIQNKRHQAGGLWMDGLRQAEKYLSDDSTVKISLYDNVGRIHQDKGRPEKAEYCFKRAMELANRHYGKNNRTTIEVTKDYAAFLNQVGRKAEAEKLWQSINVL